MRGLIFSMMGVLVAGCATARVAGRPGDAAVAVVERQLAAYNAQDLDAFAATYADEVVITDAKGAVLVQGKEALRARYAGLFAKYPRNRCRVSERRTEGETVVVDHEIITGRSPDRPDPWDAGWIRYEVEGGLIRRVALP